VVIDLITSHAQVVLVYGDGRGNWSRTNAEEEVVNFEDDVTDGGAEFIAVDHAGVKNCLNVAVGQGVIEFRRFSSGDWAAL